MARPAILTTTISHTISLRARRMMVPLGDGVRPMSPVIVRLADARVV